MGLLARNLGVSLTLALVLAACGTGDDTDTASDQGRPPTDEAAAEEPVGDFDGEGGGAIDPTLTERQIITTAFVSVHVDDVEAASREFVALVESVDGIITGEQTQLGELPRAVLTVRIPPGDLRATLDRLGAIGDISDQEIVTDDVTERVVDLDSREQTLAASVDRLRAFLDEADTVADVAALESELTRREADLESIRGQLRTLEGQVAMSTLTVTLTAEAPPDGDPGFVDAVKGGWRAMVAVADGIALTFGALLVWIPVGLILFGVYRAVALRIRQRSFRPPAPPARPAPPAPAVPARQGEVPATEEE